ncbi:large ribosomal subunit protein bL27m-like [Saccoglossus kowalevskii]|uniref:39S ribosomal protein L27, mitochondrial-like n=1 Tax=Saccoglossus kowalevskii TaxID=10224 RepID=A0ABM0GT94_SACKO|nr:PREDICTED: 39S ribosomal protein L27, mitochondrial-like [Saccoglossus kowalevskii]
MLLSSPTRVAGKLVKLDAAKFLSPIAAAVSICGARWASKKSGGSSKNHGGKSPGQRLGIKKKEGEYVQQGMILVRQKGYRWFPGSFVGVGRDKTLFALQPGIVKYSKERWIPRLDTLWGMYVAPTLSDDDMMRTFVHIIPEPQKGKFKLVDQV